MPRVPAEFCHTDTGLSLAASLGVGVAGPSLRISGGCSPAEPGSCCIQDRTGQDRTGQGPLEELVRAGGLGLLGNAG
jgi:hypothetical protein